MASSGSLQRLQPAEPPSGGDVATTGDAPYRVCCSFTGKDFAAYEPELLHPAGSQPLFQLRGLEPQLRIVLRLVEEPHDPPRQLHRRSLPLRGVVEDLERRQGLALDLLRLEDGQHLFGELASLAGAALLQ